MKAARFSAPCAFLILVASLVAAADASAMKLVFKDPDYSYQTLRVIGTAPSGGADIGEVLATAGRITEGDDESWDREWLKTAQRVAKLAEDYSAAGHAVSAKEAFLRASNYYRAAEFFLHSDVHDPRIIEISRESRSCFLRFAALSGRPVVRPVRIPYEKTTLPGYLILPDASRTKRPLLIITTGFDGTAEELYFEALPAMERGYDCLVFEGPGQGAVIREQNIPFRPDWEKVVTPVVDFAAAQPEVDPDRIALEGRSMGGYLAPRAAAFEPRIKACIVDGGIYDFHEVSTARGGPEIEKILDDAQASQKMDKTILEKMATNTRLRWVFNDGMWKFGVRTPSEWMRSTRPYRLRDVVDRIKCPMLVVDSQGDKDAPGQSRKLFEALSGPKQMILFGGEEGAEEHCQAGALALSRESILNWLDDALKK
jgi:dipeptidyl aminopeptidase/acylaminoacyl peptidase